jgi:chorismate mutase
MEIYTNDIVPVICKHSDDKNYGSSATKDIEALQALSKRIHFGKDKKKDFTIPPIYSLLL